MSDIDRKRAERLLAATGLDGLVLLQPESFRYATGAAAGVATMWGRAGAAIALVPADPARRLGAVISDHAAGGLAGRSDAIDIRTHRIWIDSVKLTGHEAIGEIDIAYHAQKIVGARPETFDQDRCFGLLADLLTDFGLSQARIGVDLSFMPAADFERLRRAIPDVTWVDASEILLKLRAIKNPREITLLRHAAAAAEAGLKAMAAAVSDGQKLPALSAAWKSGAHAGAAKAGHGLSGHWDFISVGGNLADPNAIVRPGALIKADVGALVEGYSSDGARTFVLGAPAPLAVEILKALQDAFQAGLEKIVPGNAFSDVHAAAVKSMRRSGFNEYSRGHFGHSVGANTGIEEWPFFSADSREIIEPDMVVALETPFYAPGFGALMIEDQFLVTDRGTECMNTLPRELIRL